MGLLIDRINVREKAKYEQNTIKVLNNVVKPITTREYLVPNNAKSSAVYFWQNVLLIPPVRDGHTFPLTFIPSDNQNIIVKARFSHHPSGPLDNWTKYEAMGSPNKRVDIYFFSADDSDDPNGDVEAHVISNKHLYSDSDVKLLQQALANFFKSGNFVNPFCENNENNNTKQINCNTNMNKKLIRLTESDLHRIVKESANKILKEYFNPNNDGTFKDMDDGSKYEVNGTYYDDDMEAIKKREKVMMDYCQEVIWACHQQGILPDLLKAMRTFEKKHGINTAEATYQPLNRIPIIYHNCSFSPSAERTPNY